MELTPDEIALRNNLEQELKMFRAEIGSASAPKRLEQMSKEAIKLHNSLQQRGMAPKHHKHMLLRRGSPDKTPTFYRHPHPIEDLVEYTYNQRANDDLANTTTGETFELSIRSRRWTGKDIYTIKRTSAGWSITWAGEGGDCDRKCSPHLYEILDNDLVLYPAQIGDWFEWLWEAAEDRGFTKSEVQQGIDDIAAWIKVTDIGTPSGRLWDGLV